MGRRVSFFHRLVALPLPTPLDSGLRRKGCRIGVRDMLLIAGITMALRGPHKRMKMGRRVSFFHRLVALPLPTPSGFRPLTNGGPDRRRDAANDQ